MGANEKHNAAYHGAQLGVDGAAEWERRLAIFRALTRETPTSPAEWLAALNEYIVAGGKVNMLVLAVRLLTKAPWEPTPVARLPLPRAIRAAIDSWSASVELRTAEIRAGIAQVEAAELNDIAERFKQLGVDMVGYQQAALILAQAGVPPHGAQEMAAAWVRGGR